MGRGGHGAVQGLRGGVDDVERGRGQVGDDGHVAAAALGLAVGLAEGALVGARVGVDLLLHRAGGDQRGLRVGAARGGRLDGGQVDVPVCMEEGQ